MSFLIGLIAMMGLAQAADPAKCTNLVERYENTQIQRIWAADIQSCFFSIVPLDAYKDLIYRDYMFTSDGELMVFNSFGSGDESVTTGAREFYMFPRPVEEITHVWDLDKQELTVTHVTGDKFIFDIRKARLKSMTRGNVTVADYVEPKNRGGVEISNFQGILFDGGFKRGSAPTGNGNATSYFKDVNNKSCAVKNSEVFKYTADGDIHLKFESDKAVMAFIKQRCPGLKL